MTTIVPVIEGYADSARAKRLCIAGDHVTQRLGELVQRTGPDAAWGYDPGIEQMKIRCCYTAVDLARETAVRLFFSVLLVLFFILLLSPASTKFIALFLERT
jgi:hypothetical protein